MAVTLAFDDSKLTEHVYDHYMKINEVYPLGMTFTDFLSLTGDFSKSNHVYFRVFGNSDERYNERSMVFSHFKAFIELCIKDPLIYTLDNFMFLLHLLGLSVPKNYLQYHFDPEKPIEDLVKKKRGMSPFEHAITAFAATDKSKNDITSNYDCDELEDVCSAELYHLLKNGLVIKKCGNCGKYFVPLRRSDAIYCDRSSPYNTARTCKEDGSQRTFEEKLKMDDAEKLRRSIYLTMQMRVRRNPDIPLYKAKFDAWKTEADHWKKEVKQGTKSSKEFILWLNDSKGK